MVNPPGIRYDVPPNWLTSPKNCEPTLEPFETINFAMKSKTETKISASELNVCTGCPGEPYAKIERIEGEYLEALERPRSFA